MQRSLARQVGLRRKAYVWMTADHKTIPVTKMLTRHLYNCVRMLWNHTVPEQYRFERYTRYNMNLDMSERNKAVKAMLEELKTRHDILPHEADDLNRMIVIAQQHLAMRLDVQ